MAPVATRLDGGPAPAELPRACADAVRVLQRRYPGVVPMGPDPHGDHTGIEPGPHQANAGKDSLPEAAGGTRNNRRKRLRTRRLRD
jgi:hypothetical protein